MANVIPDTITRCLDCETTFDWQALGYRIRPRTPRCPLCAVYHRRKLDTNRSLAYQRAHPLNVER